MSDAVSADLLNRAKAGDGEARMELARLAARAGKKAEADHWILEAAAAGQRNAILQTGAWKLTGYLGAVDIHAGAAIIRSAAEAGDPAAKTLYAALLTTGMLGERDWPTARALLLEAAEGHDPRALTQIALMLPLDKKWQPTRLALFDRAAGKGYPGALFFAGRTLLEEGGQEDQALARLTLAARSNEPNALRILRGRRVATEQQASPMFELSTINWARVAEAVQWPHERRLPQPIVRHAAPRVATLNRLLLRDECDYIVSRGAPFLKRAQSAGADTQGRRTNTTALFGPMQTDVLIQSLDELISRALGAHPVTGDTLALMHYAPGQAFVPSGSPSAVPQATIEQIDRTHLVKTIIVYLNDGYEGGESSFPRLGWRYKGRRGDALMWHVRNADNEVDPRSIPEGTPPRAGEKFVLSKWIRAHVEETQPQPRQAQA